MCTKQFCDLLQQQCKCCRERAQNFHMHPNKKSQNISITAGCCYSRLLPVKPSSSQKISGGFHHRSIKHKHHKHKRSSPLWAFPWQKQYPLSPKKFALI